jgi:hypothetical protein
MPQPSYDEIIRELLDRGVAPGADDDANIDTLMQDPEMMKSLSGGRKPNSDMMTNPQSYVTMNPPPPQPFDPIGQGEQFDDTQTKRQSRRIDESIRDKIWVEPRTPTINPTQRPRDPNRDDLDALFPDYSLSEPNVSNMEKLYRRMPMPQPPNASGQMQTPDQYQNYNVPKQYEQPDLNTMQQLMEFYQGGSDV